MFHLKTINLRNPASENVGPPLVVRMLEELKLFHQQLERTGSVSASIYHNGCEGVSP